MAVAVMALVNIIAFSNVSVRREYGIDVNADFPPISPSGHTSGFAFANSSGRLSLSSAQFALS